MFPFKLFSTLRRVKSVGGDETEAGVGVFSRGARRWGVIGSRARAFQPDADEPLFSIPAATRAGSITGDGLRALVS